MNGQNGRMVYPTVSPPPSGIRWDELELGTLQVGMARLVPAADLTVNGEYRTKHLTQGIHYHARKAGVKVSMKKRPEGLYITRIG